jgi:hypothetical protein
MIAAATMSTRDGFGTGRMRDPLVSPLDPTLGLARIGAQDVDVQSLQRMTTNLRYEPPH